MLDDLDQSQRLHNGIRATRIAKEAIQGVPDPAAADSQCSDHILATSKPLFIPIEEGKKPNEDSSR